MKKNIVAKIGTYLCKKGLNFVSKYIVMIVPPRRTTTSTTVGTELS